MSPQPAYRAPVQRFNDTPSKSISPQSAPMYLHAVKKLVQAFG